jgi:thiamine-monophosphate kinase
MPASEFDLIAAINERLPTTGERVRISSGDDAAVVEAGGDASAISVDAIVEGVHFRLADFGAAAVGRKALAAGLSDLAAMGALPGEAYVVVAAPPELGDDVLLGIAEGLAEVAKRHGVTIAGGDLVSSPVLMVSVTSVGYEPQGSQLVTRAGARPGDLVAVTGRLGGAAGALALLQGGGASISPELREAMLIRQLDPTPRLREGLVLAAEGATAMIDITDGLGADAGHLARASGCRLEIDLDRIPLVPGLEEVAGGSGPAIELAASGGEDYELLVALPTDWMSAAAEAVASAGTELTEIGYVTGGHGVTLKLPGGGEIQPRGFDQRRGSLSGSG